MSRKRGYLPDMEGPSNEREPLGPKPWLVPLVRRLAAGSAESGAGLTADGGSSGNARS